MALAGSLVPQGIRVIAVSRFAYLRTAVLGASDGALSAMQMAIRHPERVTALILLVPIAYKPVRVGYGTYANAEYTASRIAGATFRGCAQGGHLWVGHDDEVLQLVATHGLTHGTP